MFSITTNLCSAVNVNCLMFGTYMSQRQRLSHRGSFSLCKKKIQYGKPAHEGDSPSRGRLPPSCTPTSKWSMDIHTYLAGGDPGGGGGGVLA